MADCVVARHAGRRMVLFADEIQCDVCATIWTASGAAAAILSKSDPTGDVLRCQGAGCRAVLGVLVGDRGYIRHRGRRYAGQLVAVQCELCATVWRAPVWPAPVGHVPTLSVA